MRGTIVLAVATLLEEAVTELEQRPHALTVEEILALFVLALTFKMPNYAGELIERMRIAQSTLSG